MWTSTLNRNLNRVLLTKLLGRVYPDIYYSSLSPLRVANIPRSALPAANWVRVRNRLAGICDSDLHLVYADADARISVVALPNYKYIYPGREVVGEVIEIGEEVQYLSVGDRVVLQYMPNCLSTGAKPVCRACNIGNYNLCEYGTLPGPEPIGGGWCEEMLLHEQQLFRLPIELSDEQGVMLEPTAVALHAILRHLPQKNDNILIIGAGTIGLLTLQVLRTLIPKVRISMLARYPFQIEQATRLGANNIIYPANPYASVQRATQARLYKGMLNNSTLVGGYDVIYDTVGQQKTLHHALRWLRSQGTMVIVGRSLHMMNIDLTPIWHQETNLLGSLSHGIETWPPGAGAGSMGSLAHRSTFSIVTELIEQKHLQPEQLITRRFSLNNYKDALKSASNKKSYQSIKVLFDYSLLPASAVPNVHASVRPHRPALSQPQSNAFMEEFLQSQNGTLPHQDAEQERVPLPNAAQQTVPPKILDTPAPQPLTKEPWRTILNLQDFKQDEINDDDTDTTMPAIRRLPYIPRVSSRATESPQTPMPIAKKLNAEQANQASTPAIHQSGQINFHKEAEKRTHISATPKTEIPADISAQQQSADATLHFHKPTFEADYIPVTSLPIDLTPELAVEKSETIINQSEDISLLRESQQADDINDIEAAEQDATLLEIISALPAPDIQDTELSSEVEQLPLPDHTVLKLPANAGEHVAPFPETINRRELTEEQLSTHNILDNLFEADTSSMPAFLEQLPNFAAPILPEKPIEDMNTSTLPDLASPDAQSLLDASVIALPDAPTLPDLASSDASSPVGANFASSTLKLKKKRKRSKPAQSNKTMKTNVRYSDDSPA
jgi:threonine dehydrogenase-like Zn-dependent dehydrogenase